MMRGWLIEDEGRTAEAFRRELVDPAIARLAERERATRAPQLLGGWVIERSSGRPALRLAWHAVDAAPLAAAMPVA